MPVVDQGFRNSFVTVKSRFNKYILKVHAGLSSLF